MNKLLSEQLGRKIVRDLFGDSVQDEGGRSLIETWFPPAGSNEAKSLMDFTQEEKAEAKRIVEEAAGLDAKSFFGLGTTFGRLLGRRDAKKPLLIEDSTDQPDEKSVIANRPTLEKRFLTEQERVELCQSLGIPTAGYRRREWAILEELQKQNDDELLRVVELFEDRVIYESRSSVFQSGYSLIEGSVKLLDTVRLEGTVAMIEEQLRSDRRKKFFERKAAGLHSVKPVRIDESRLTTKQREDREMAGFFPKSEKKESLLLERESVALDEATLTPRQKKDQKIAGLI